MKSYEDIGLTNRLKPANSIAGQESKFQNALAVDLNQEPTPYLHRTAISRGTIFVGTINNVEGNEDPRMRLYILGTVNDYFGMEVINLGLGSVTTADFVAIAGTPISGNNGRFIDMGMAGPSWNDPSFAVFDANSGYVFTFADNLYIASGGTGTTGNIYFATGGLNNKNLIRGNIDANGNFFVGRAALATNATNGFFNIPSCAGTPTGTPTLTTGLVPMVYDTTNNVFWIYNSGWRRASGTYS